MNNTNATQIQNLVSKLPTTIFFEQLPDRTQVLKYIEWLNKNVPETKTVNQDQFFREVISKELRIVGMKITEIEILLVAGLNTVTLNDFSIDSKTLIQKLINENPDNYDLDIMYRILAQIMTKLPKDLKERVTGKHKLQIFQKIAQSINIDNTLLEKFVSLDPSLNTPNELTMDLEGGDYNTLNKKYLNELQKYEAAKGYLNSNSIEYADIAQKMVDNTPATNKKEINAEYIDNNPDFMLGKNDNILYYYDSSSGTLSEMPLNDKKQTQVSIQDLKTILTGNKIKKSDIDELIDDMKTVPTKLSLPAVTVLSSDPSYAAKPSNFFDMIGSYFTSMFSTEATATTSPVSTLSSISQPIQITEPKLRSQGANSNRAPEPPLYIKQQANSGGSGSGGSGSGGSGGGSGVSGGSGGGSSGSGSSGSSGSGSSGGSSGGADSPNKYDEYNQPNKPNTYIPFEQPTAGSRKDRISYDLEKKFQERKKTYETFISNMNANIHNNETSFLNKMKNDNKNIENVALGFVSVIIIVFLLVIFNSIRNNNNNNNTIKSAKLSK